jgi:hypothetical protein
MSYSYYLQGKKYYVWKNLRIIEKPSAWDARKNGGIRWKILPVYLCVNCGLLKIDEKQAKSSGKYVHCIQLTGGGNAIKSKKEYRMYDYCTGRRNV